MGMPHDVTEVYAESGEDNFLLKGKSFNDATGNAGCGVTCCSGDNEQILRRGVRHVTDHERRGTGSAETGHRTGF